VVSLLILPQASFSSCLVSAFKRAVISKAEVIAGSGRGANSRTILVSRVRHPHDAILLLAMMFCINGRDFFALNRAMPAIESWIKGHCQFSFSSASS
jgi:hypothetical protein